MASEKSCDIFTHSFWTIFVDGTNINPGLCWISPLSNFLLPIVHSSTFEIFTYSFEPWWWNDATFHYLVRLPWQTKGIPVLCLGFMRIFLYVIDLRRFAFRSLTSPSTESIVSTFVAKKFVTKWCVFTLKARTHFSLLCQISCYHLFDS